MEYLSNRLEEAPGGLIFSLTLPLDHLLFTIFAQ